MNSENQNLTNQEINQTPPTIIDVPKKQAYWIIYVVFLFVGILVGVGGILGYQKLSINTQPIPISSLTPEATPDPTAGWETYTNTEYGFSFKYPKTATFEITNATDTEFNMTLSNLTGVKYEELVIFVGKTWADTNASADSVSNYTVDGLNAYREDLPSGQNPPQSLVYVKNNNYYYTIQQTKDLSDPEIEGIFNQILSTFKFTSETPAGDTSTCEYNGRTYQNGDNVPSGDGCNTCSCDKGKVSCTTMMCD